MELEQQLLLPEETLAVLKNAESVARGKPTAEVAVTDDKLCGIRGTAGPEGRTAGPEDRTAGPKGRTAQGTELSFYSNPLNMSVLIENVSKFSDEIAENAYDRPMGAKNVACYFTLKVRVPVRDYVFFYKTLPNTEDGLVCPCVYLSAEQRATVLRHPELEGYASHLPCWIPMRMLSAADPSLPVIHQESAKIYLGGRNFVWATEFENLHRVWTFREREIVADDKLWESSEKYYQACKPYPYSDEEWFPRRRCAMFKAVWAKFSQSKPLKELLLSTGRIPLLAIKPDRYWGVVEGEIGDNALALLLELVRALLTAYGAPEFCEYLVRIGNKVASEIEIWDRAQGAYGINPLPSSKIIDAVDALWRPAPPTTTMTTTTTIRTRRRSPTTRCIAITRSSASR